MSDTQQELEGALSKVTMKFNAHHYQQVQEAYGILGKTQVNTVTCLYIHVHVNFVDTLCRHHVCKCLVFAWAFFTVWRGIFYVCRFSRACCSSTLRYLEHVHVHTLMQQHFCSTTMNIFFTSIIIPRLYDLQCSYVNLYIHCQICPWHHF